MNFTKKIMIVVVISLASIFVICDAHAQTLNYGYSNATQPLQGSNVTSNNPNNSTVSSSGIDQSCISKMTDEMQSNAQTLDNVKAISLATNQSEFKSETLGYALPYSSIFNTWKLDTTNCTVSWNDVNVAYQLYNGTHYVKTVVVTLDPALTQVTKVEEQVAPSFTTPTSNAIWSGYDLEGSSSLPTVLSSFAAYNLPSVSPPTFVINPCDSSLGPTYQPCDTSIWTGLEDKVGATDGNLVQAGSDGVINCTGYNSTDCTTSYFLWYDFYPNSGFTCGSSSMSPNDAINLNVTNDQKGGGSDTNYDLSLQDTTANFGCTVTRESYSAMTSPIYAPFILERAQNEASHMPGYPATLAVFGTPTPQITGTMYYSGSNTGISSATIAAQWEMSNQGNTNINLGSISSNSFTETWQASDGTYGTCVPPRTGDLTISASCTVPNNAVAQGNVIVQSGNLMTIPSGVTLTVPFTTNHLLVDSGGGVLIQAGGKIS